MKTRIETVNGRGWSAKAVRIFGRLYRVEKYGMTLHLVVYRPEGDFFGFARGLDRWHETRALNACVRAGLVG